MKLIFAPDSLKGSLSSSKEIAILRKTASEIFPGCETVGIPMADGGEGTVEALLEASGGRFITVTVRGPLGEDEEASYGLLEDGCAVIEMSAASGLPLVPQEKRNPEKTSCFGTGELIKDALDRGAKKLLVCVGGSATNDGGTGMLAALGLEFYDTAGKRLRPSGESLAHIASVSRQKFDLRVRQIPLEILCDVKNPLCGETGATRVFGPQKGADAAMSDRLEAGMLNWAAVTERETGIRVADMPGAGAAGGLAAALCAWCGGTLISGIEAVLKAVDFDRRIEGAGLIVTGEGCLDSQTANGKVVSGIGRHAMTRGIPVYCLPGGLKLSPQEAAAFGVTKIFPMVGGDVSFEESMAQAEAVYERRARELLNTWKKEIKP